MNIFVLGDGDEGLSEYLDGEVSSHYSENVLFPRRVSEFRSWIEASYFYTTISAPFINDLTNLAKWLVCWLPNIGMLSYPSEYFCIITLKTS